MMTLIGNYLNLVMEESVIFEKNDKVSLKSYDTTARTTSAFSFKNNYFLFYIFAS
jgi:hypothetical protein